MKYYELDKEEEKIISSFDEGDFKALGQSSVKKYQDYARVTVGKKEQINIRLSARDLRKLKSQASKKGVPYQTLISSVLHQYADR